MSVIVFALSINFRWSILTFLSLRVNRTKNDSIGPRGDYGSRENKRDSSFDGDRSSLGRCVIFFIFYQSLKVNRTTDTNSIDLRVNGEQKFSLMGPHATGIHSFHQPRVLVD